MEELLDKMPGALVIDIMLEEDDNEFHDEVCVEDDTPMLGVALALVLEVVRTDVVELGIELLVKTSVDVGRDVLDGTKVGIVLKELVEVVERLVILKNMAKLDEVVALVVLLEENDDVAELKAETVVEVTF